MILGRTYRYAWFEATSFPPGNYAVLIHYFSVTAQLVWLEEGKVTLLLKPWETYCSWYTSLVKLSYQYQMTVTRLQVVDSQ